MSSLRRIGRVSSVQAVECLHRRGPLRKLLSDQCAWMVGAPAAGRPLDPQPPADRIRGGDGVFRTLKQGGRCEGRPHRDRGFDPRQDFSRSRATFARPPRLPSGQSHPPTHPPPHPDTAPPIPLLGWAAGPDGSADSAAARPGAACGSASTPREREIRDSRPSHPLPWVGDQWIRLLIWKIGSSIANTMPITKTPIVTMSSGPRRPTMPASSASSSRSCATAARSSISSS